jgi:hypothetical protein
MMWTLLLVLAQSPVTFWPGEHEKAVLAEWAMEHWAAAGGFTVKKVRTAEEAEVRFRWVNPRRAGLYGQSQRLVEKGQWVNEVVVNPSAVSLGPEMALKSEKDPLYGEVILFLTCVHEAGHALDAQHTSNYADIMYSFEYGGDFTAYFQRYRDRLKERSDMKRQSPLSVGDIKQIRAAAQRRSERR